MNARVSLIHFVLTAAEQEPVSRRIGLYRGLAEICGDERESAQLRDLADHLEGVEKRCGEFVFRFEQKESIQDRHGLSPFEALSGSEDKRDAK
jgi:hypothetical protein